MSTAGADDVVAVRVPIARNTGTEWMDAADNPDRVSTAGGEGDAEARDVTGVCPIGASAEGVAGGAMAGRGVRMVGAEEN